MNTRNIKSVVVEYNVTYILNRFLSGNIIHFKDAIQFLFQNTLKNIWSAPNLVYHSKLAEFQDMTRSITTDRLFSEKPEPVRDSRSVSVGSCFRIPSGVEVGTRLLYTSFSGRSEF